MTYKDLQFYPNRDIGSFDDALNNFHGIFKRPLHNGGFTHDKDRSIDIHNSSGYKTDTLGHYWYQGEVKSFSSDGSNPYTSNGECVVTGQSYNHSYNTYFEIGSGSDILYMPDVSGFGMYLQARTTDGKYNQEPNIESVYARYKRTNNSSTYTFKIPFPTSNPGSSTNRSVVCGFNGSGWKTAELGNSYRDYIRSNNLVFKSLIFKIQVIRNGSTSKIPVFKIKRVTFRQKYRNGGLKYIVPRNLRSRTSDTVRYT